MRLAPEQLQVFAHGAFDLAVSGQHAASRHAKAFRSLSFRNPIILDALFDDDAGGFLRKHVSGPIKSVRCLPAHGQIRGTGPEKSGASL
jgi:hypothetical protein